MRLAILGATGLTGLEAVKQALSRGHTVTALVRTPAKISALEQEGLTVTQCDVFNKEEVTKALKGHQAVVSCLGFPPEKPAVTGYLEVTKVAVEAMKEHGIKRLVVCHSWYTEEASRAQAPFILRWTLIPYIRTILDNMRETEVWLEEQEGIDFTVVRPAGLTNSPVTDSQITAREGEYFVSGGGMLAGRIARADVARFMLDSLNTEVYSRKQVAIAV